MKPHLITASPSSWRLRSYSSTALQTISHSNAISYPVYNFLPETQNPNYLVTLVCAYLKQKDTSIWNTLQEQGLFAKFSNHDLSRILLRSQSDSSANLAFFNWVQIQLGTNPNLQNCCIMIHNLVWSKKFKQGMNILLHIVQLNEVGIFESLLLCTNNCNWEPVVFDMLIKAYLRKEMVKEGFKTFKKMVKLCFVPSLQVVNTLLNKLAKIDSSPKCWWIYEEMQRIGLHPNSFTVNILANMLCKEGNVEQVNTFLERAENKGFYPDIVTYNMLIHQHCKTGKLKDAIHLYNIMCRRNVIPDLITYTTLIRCLCNAGSIKEATSLFNLMVQRDLKPDIFAYNTLMYGYCKEGMMKEARFLLFDMIGLRINPDDFTCQVLIKGYLNTYRMISAMNLMLELTRLGIQISEETYCLLIICLCKDDRPFAAKSLFSKMSRYGYKQDKTMYSEMIDCLCRGKYVNEAIDLKDEMVELRGMKPDITTYTSIITCLCGLERSNEAIILMQEMIESGFSVDVEMFRSLFNVHCKTKSVEDAERLLCFYAEKANFFDSECYNVITRAIVEECDVCELMKFQVRMSKLGFVPNGLTCSYAIQGMHKAIISSSSAS